LHFHVDLLVRQGVDRALRSVFAAQRSAQAMANVGAVGKSIGRRSGSQNVIHSGSDRLQRLRMTVDIESPVIK
jgi:hypothetical protein